MNSSSNVFQYVDLVYWMGLLEQKMLEGATEILLKTKNLNNLTHTSFLQGYKPSPCMP